MAGTVLQKPQGLEEGQTGHRIISSVVGDPWNQSHVAGSCLLVLALGLLGSRNLSICTPVGLGTLCSFDFLSPFLGELECDYFFLLRPQTNFICFGHL